MSHWNNGEMNKVQESGVSGSELKASSATEDGMASVALSTVSDPWIWIVIMEMTMFFHLSNY